MTAPTWQELCDAGWAVTDEQSRHLAVYPASDGTVVIVVHAGDGQLHRIPLSLMDVVVLEHALKRAYDIAGPIVAEGERQFALVTAHEAIERAKGAT